MYQENEQQIKIIMRNSTHTSGAMNQCQISQQVKGILAK